MESHVQHFGRDADAAPALLVSPGRCSHLGFVRHPEVKAESQFRAENSLLWIASALAVVAIGFRPLFTISPSPAEISWLLLHPWVRYLVEALIVIFFIISVMLPVGTVIWKKLTKRPRKYPAALKSFSYFFPATWTERRWWVFVCITAGVCEETLFRGFMLHYLHVFPWTLNLTLSLLISSVIFGFNHLYGGAGGVVGSAVGGFLFGLLFLLTGNLLLSIIFHGLIDLRMLAILQPPADYA